VLRFADFLRFRVSVFPWSVLPAPLWFLVASPLLSWAWGVRPWFVWPLGRSRSPFRLSFWWGW
jgi:hypothetical protein